MSKRQITQEELANALLLSEFHQRTHLNFIPSGTSFTEMLLYFRRKKWAYSMGEQFWKLSKAGKTKFFSNKTEAKNLIEQTIFTSIDKFVDNL